MPSPTTVEITRARARDVPAIGGTLASAFHHDPVFEWIVPDAAARRVGLPSAFAAFAEVYVGHHTELAAEGAAAALWAPAGVAPMTDEQQQTFAERIAGILGPDAERAFDTAAVLDEHHPDQPCAYLQFLGVVPARQGRGLGSQLLAAMLSRCDATATPAYLEATSPANRRLYERHGFATVSEVVLPDGPPVWPMWREPGAVIPG